MKSPANKDLDAVFGQDTYVPLPELIEELSNKIDVLELKIDAVRSDLLRVGIGVLAVGAILYFR